MEIKNNIICWLLHTTLVGNQGECLDQQLYQHSNAIDMRDLYKDRKETKAEWESEKNPCVKYHLHLTYVCSYGSAGILVSESDAEDLLEAHAKHEQALLDAQKA